MVTDRRAHDEVESTSRAEIERDRGSVGCRLPCDGQHHDVVIHACAPFVSMIGETTLVSG